MLVIRLRRIGRSKDPHYRIVVTEHTAPVQGKFLAEVGHYHPKTHEVSFNKDAFTEWMGKGAQPSNTVARLANRAKIVETELAIKQETGAPKKKAQEMAAAKAEKAAQPAPAPVAEAAPAEETAEVEADAPEIETQDEGVSEEPAAEAEAPAEDTAADSTEASE